MFPGSWKCLEPLDYVPGTWKCLEPVRFACHTSSIHMYAVNWNSVSQGACQKKTVYEVILGLILVNIKIQHPCCPTEVLVASGTCT